MQREKQSWEDVEIMKDQGIIKPDSSGKIVLGKSLGSFSISLLFLKALLEEYREELSRKKGKFDTDSHLWMPITSSKEEFISHGKDGLLWDRVDRFRKTFLEKKPGIILGDKDLGTATFWWDYGQLKLYYQNFLKLLSDSLESNCMRKFYRIEEDWIKREQNDRLWVKNSIIIDCSIQGKIEESVLIGVESEGLEVKRGVIVDSCIAKLITKESLLYNCVELEDLYLPEKTALSDIFLPGKGRIRMKNSLERDGKEDWEQTIPGNFYSCEELRQSLSGKEIAGIKEEKQRWKAYYRQRKDIAAALERIVLIKPQSPNLVETVWGGEKIEKFKDIPPSGKKIGESWECSGHHLHPSRLTFQGKITLSLPHLLSLKGRDILGNGYHSFRGRLPLLLKLIEARENLSVQVHPADKDAGKLKEEDGGKEEAWLVLEAEKDAVIYLGFKQSIDKKKFKKDLFLPEVNIAEKYLNAFSTQAGDLFFIPPGIIHSIGKGIMLCEIQQPSGITYRAWDWNRLPKRTLHIEKALAVLDLDKTSREDFQIYPQAQNDREERLINTGNFAVDRVTLCPGESITRETGGTFCLLLCLQGTTAIKTGKEEEMLSEGESLLVPAFLASFELIAEKKAVILVCYPPLFSAISR